jgi:hypothetical protein
MPNYKNGSSGGDGKVPSSSDIEIADVKMEGGDDDDDEDDMEEVD